jgi:hypothetical protein
MSRLTRTGLWLLPWLPAAFVAVIAMAHYHPEMMVGDPRWRAASLIERIYAVAFQLTLLAFLLGIVFLLISAVRYLVRLRRQSA